MYIFYLIFVQFIVLILGVHHFGFLDIHFRALPFSSQSLKGTLSLPAIAANHKWYFDTCVVSFPWPSSNPSFLSFERYLSYCERRRAGREPGNEASVWAVGYSALLPTAGGAEEWWDLQWPSGELRQLDEHSASGSDLYLQGKTLAILVHVHVKLSHTSPTSPNLA